MNMLDPSTNSSSADFALARVASSGYFSVMARHEPERFLDSFAALARAVRATAAQAYDTFEVGSTQAKFLRHIAKHRHISQAELARATVTDAALTGRVLQAMLERGWVRRERSDDDRRQYVLQLSASGQRQCKRVEVARQKIAKRMVAALEDRDLDDFERVAQKLLVALGSVG